MEQKLERDISSECGVEIFTDGGCSNGIGGWAWKATITDAEGKIGYAYANSGGKIETTNNQMELTAVIEVLKFISDFEDKGEVVVNTDSQYVTRGITEWITKWKVNGWKTSNRRSVENQDLWMELNKLVSIALPTFKWIKGHSGIEGNKCCDKMVEASIKHLKEKS